MAITPPLAIPPDKKPATAADQKRAARTAMMRQMQQMYGPPR